MSQSQQRPAFGWFWLGLLLLLTVAYRLYVAGSEQTSLMNTAPLMAMCFGGGLLLGFRFAWVPPVVLLASDLALGAFAGTGPGLYTLMSAAVYVAAALAGAWLGSAKGGALRQSWVAMFCGTLASSVIFYLVANTFSWALAPEFYSQTFAGWWQSQTVGTGIPGIPPSTYFLRNAMIGDTVWCLLAGPLFFWKAVRISKPAFA